MTKIKIYDKVSWHYPEGNCTSLKAAKSHFIAIMKWLKENELLSHEGEEIFDLGIIDSDFSITSSMLNKKGNDVIMKCYPPPLA